MAENIGGIPVLDIGAPKRGDLYAKSLQELDGQGLAPEQKINPNPKKEISPELQKEINSNLSATEKQSLEYLRLKALNVQTAIEKAKGPHNAERGAFVIEKEGKDTFSLTSFGQKTKFTYFKNSNNVDVFKCAAPGFEHTMVMTYHTPEEMIRLVNFINFGKDFIRDNINNIPAKPKSDKIVDWPFYEAKEGTIFCRTNRVIIGVMRVLKSEHNFGHDTNNVMAYLNYLYREEIKNQKVDDKNRLIPFPPK